jgi:hypothetical protein
MAGEETVTRLCFCSERLNAQATFRYSHSFGGWYFVSAPTRMMSPVARYYAFSERSEFRHEDHTGEPMIHVECPWCQNTLPGVRLEDEKRRPFGGSPQGDGGED